MPKIGGIAYSEAASVDMTALPNGWPTHLHSEAFWSELGRAVATFGFLEETLWKALCAFTMERSVNEEAYLAWRDEAIELIVKTSSDTLGALIRKFEISVESFGQINTENLHELLAELRKSLVWRNALCHGSWPPLNDEGKAIPFYVDRKHGRFSAELSAEKIAEVRMAVVEQICGLVSVVTSMGWRFPGST